ncbi:TATA-box-binding protein [Cryptosporidium andersoni]|uniref:TATA-box-binding protein n=1 Tax=Cryptosporidium andersoni TaxID=117008 RepID=A0A1J4MS95_9CRYT|nr:TATA-box-binding protein [Cryptosporidium andersoni]
MNIKSERDFINMDDDEEFVSNIEVQIPSQPMVLNIYNVMASAYSGINIDLDWFVESFGNTYYEPCEFPAARVDIQHLESNSIVTMSVFSNGKLQATGGATVAASKVSMKKLIIKLRRLGMNKAKLLNFEVHNIQAVVDAGFPINLRLLCSNYIYVDYEPERNPGAKIRIPPDYINDKECNPEYLHKKTLASQYNNGSKLKIEIVTLTVHFSGKIGMAGARSINSLDKVLNYIKPYLIKSRLT